MATGRLPDPNTAPVTAKGDLYTYSTVPAKLAVGNNGETLVADSSASTGLRWQGNFAAGKNKIINGDFNIWQRGTTFTNATVNTFTSDRWFFGGSGNNTGSISRQTFTPGTAPVAGYEGKFFYRFDQTSTAISPSILQRIEDVQTLAGQQVTVSFWVKTSSNVTGGITNVYLEQNFGSGGSATVGSLVIDTTNTTTSWARVSGTVTLPSIAGKTVGTSSYLNLVIYPKASSIITFDIWGVQVEAGSTATAFQTATGTLAGELAAAMRYYYRVDSANAGDTRMNTANMVANSTTVAYGNFSFPVRMRTSPTFGSSTATGWSLGRIAAALTALAQERASVYSSMVKATVASGLTAGNGDWLEAGNNNTAYIEFSAEL